MLKIPVSSSSNVLCISTGFYVGVNTELVTTGFSTLVSGSIAPPTGRTIRIRRFRNTGGDIYKPINGIVVAIAPETFEIPDPDSYLTIIGYDQGSACLVNTQTHLFDSSFPTINFTGQDIDAYVNISPRTALIISESPPGRVETIISDCYTVEYGFCLVVSLGFPSVGSYRCYLLNIQCVTPNSAANNPSTLPTGGSDTRVTIDSIYASLPLMQVSLADQQFKGGTRFISDEPYKIKAVFILGI